MVLSDEFTEIEDPDPDRHRERQRELISELDEARKELEKTDGKGKRRFTFFGRGAKDAAKKKDWETYEDSSTSNGAGGGAPETDPEKMPDGGVLFDVDAIRAELAKAEKEEKKAGASHLGPPTGLRHAKSFGDAAAAGGGGRSAAGGYRSTSYSTTRLDEYRGEDSDSEDEFGNRRKRRGEEEPTLTFDEYQPARSGGWGGGGGYQPSGGYRTEVRSVSTSGYESSGYRPELKSSNTSGYETGGGYKPELKSSSTFPAVAGGAAVGLAGGLAIGAVGRNVWADDDDDEFACEEGEMTMTFA